MDGSRKKAALVVFLFVHEPLHRNRAVVLYRQSIFWCYVFVAGSPQPPPKWSNESHSVTLAAMCRGELCCRSNLCTSAPNRSNMRSTPTWPLAAAWCIAVRPWQHEAKHTTVKTAHLGFRTKWPAAAARPGRRQCRARRGAGGGAGSPVGAQTWRRGAGQCGPGGPGRVSSRPRRCPPSGRAPPERNRHQRDQAPTPTAHSTPLMHIVRARDACGMRLSAGKLWS